MPAAPLAEGVKPGRLDAEIASGPPAVAQIKAVSTAKPDEMNAAWTGLADAIRECECKPNLPRVKALFYLIQRGPD